MSFQIRCSNCNKRFMNVVEAKLFIAEIKCDRCGEMNKLNFPEIKPRLTSWQEKKLTIEKNNGSVITS